MSRNSADGSLLWEICGDAIQTVKGTESMNSRLQFAPPPFAINGDLAVPIDIQRVVAQLRFDPLGRDTLDANVCFTTGTATGFPVFDLRQTVREAWLDGVPLPVDRIAATDFGGGRDADMRVIRRRLSPGTQHDLRLAADLATPLVRLDKNRLPTLQWEKSSRLSFRFGFTDTRAGRYLESWIPANLIYDEFELVINLEVAQTLVPHCVITTGTLVQLAFNRWQVRFPAMTTASSPLLEIHASDRVTSQSADVFLPVSRRMVRAEVWKELGDSTELPRALAEIESSLSDFELAIGPYRHGDRFVYFADEKSAGMEYAGGATGKLSALRHELCHSWWGRGVRPASQSDAWIDEGVTIWTADLDRTSRKAWIDSTSRPTELRLGQPWSRAMSPASHRVGGKVFKQLAALMGTEQLAAILRELFDKQANIPLTTTALEVFLNTLHPCQWAVDLFHHQVYGFPSHQQAPQLSFAVPASDPVDRLWNHPALRVRHQPDEGEDHQHPLANHENWVYARMRNSGDATVAHAVVVFRADEVPIFDVGGMAIAARGVAASVQENWQPDEERLIAVAWHPTHSIPTRFVLSAQVLAQGLGDVAQGILASTPHWASKSVSQRTVFPGDEVFLSLSLGNQFATEHQTLNLEFIRPPHHEQLECLFLDADSFPLNAASNHQRIRRNRDNQPSEEGDDDFDDPTDVPFPHGPSGALSFDMPPRALLHAALVVQVPPDLESAESLPLHFVARRSDGEITCGLTVIFNIP